MCGHKKIYEKRFDEDLSKRFENTYQFIYKLRTLTNSVSCHGKEFIHMSKVTTRKKSIKYYYLQEDIPQKSDNGELQRH